MNKIFSKFLLVALVIALALTALPLQAVSAAPAQEDKPTQDPATQNARLELVFARQKLAVDMQTALLTNAENLIEKAQNLIDQAKKNGKDVSGVQTALDNLKAAIEKAEPLHDQSVALVNTHAGFDAGGKVTDVEKAKTTVKSLAELNKQFRETLRDATKALREAIKDFREANPRPTPTPKP